ncbi:MAG: PadR family transcriptional regulator [Cytophagales bacterium CG12_big_fil_rev_8_21_14_0_65_40_12]|nr:MAG: PadR family transcriptional regulator [Cytophagales bacterium CG12_big_fil_rev_8_21_14_0_65_40_12]PIW02960.1 MAG: PadR family transcriptional regulator [Cytophagales bacterium CG17_big_fil_post_rev_8_21_14_2_50_40_13]
MYSRELLKGILKPIILKLLSEEEKMYGYEIVQKVKEKTEGKLLIKEGSLYPTLHALTTEGYLTTESVIVDSRTRKYYSLTNKGKGLAIPAIQELFDFQATLKLIFGNKNPAIS